MSISWTTTYPIATASSEGAPLKLSGSSASEPKRFFKKLAQECRYSSSSMSKNNFRAERFFLLHVAIERMGHLPQQHPLHIRPEVQGSALGVLGVLKENFNVDPPVLSTSEDGGVVLKWSEGSQERMLMLDGEELDLIDRTVGKPSYTVHSATESDQGAELKLIFDHFGSPIPASV